LVGCENGLEVFQADKINLGGIGAPVCKRIGDSANPGDDHKYQVQNEGAKSEIKRIMSSMAHGIILFSGTFS
jgi:hypothetical protein